MKGECLPVTRLTDCDRQQMFTLLDRHFHGVDRDSFDADLDEKTQAILFRDNGVLRGFSTLLHYTTIYRGEKLGIVYSGDTIIEPGAWGSLQLPRTWIKAVREICAKHPADRHFWLLIVSGFRTYRFLPVFWQDFYPRYDRQTPAEIQRLLDYLATQRFGQAFDPGRGTVSFPRPQVLRDFLSEIPAARPDPNVGFFERVNPGWKNGDELVCLTEIRDDNLTLAGYRMVFANSTRAKDPVTASG